jgi:hypothetical protein
MMTQPSRCQALWPARVRPSPWEIDSSTPISNTSTNDDEDERLAELLWCKSAVYLNPSLTAQALWPARVRPSPWEIDSSRSMQA